MGLLLYEHGHFTVIQSDADELWDQEKFTLSIPSSKYLLFQTLQARSFGKGRDCYTVKQNEDGYMLQADYYIGLDWLGETGRHIIVEPKINRYSGRRFAELADQEPKEDDEDFDPIDKVDPDEKQTCRVDYLRMLLDIMGEPVIAKEAVGLVQIDWETSRIPIDQKDDHLTPFLIVQFVQLLRQIVHKGLKKSYYKVQENLVNRVKGKVLVSQQIKKNTVHNRHTHAYCEYQVLGEDNRENRFLKKVLRFVRSYVENHSSYFSRTDHVQQTLCYVNPAFERIGDLCNDEQLCHFKHNPFFKEYKEAIQIGQYILKRFAYNISNTSEQKTEIPPFWIDMPRLFELYVYQKLLQANGHDTQKILYQFATYGNALDILVKDGKNSMIIDAKYKLHYSHSYVHQDIRQVAGYARLKTVRKTLGLQSHDDRNIDCLIVYPDMRDGLDLENSAILRQKFYLTGIKGSFSENKNQIQAYHKVYKIGIRLPFS